MSGEHNWYKLKILKSDMVPVMLAQILFILISRPCERFMTQVHWQIGEKRQIGDQELHVLML